MLSKLVCMFAVVGLCVACLGSSLLAQEPKVRHTLEGHVEVVSSVAFSPDGKTLASASQDGTIKLWDVQAGKERTTLKERKEVISSVAFSPDGKTLASSGSDDGTIKLWDVQTGKVQATLKGHKVGEGVRSVAFS